MHTNEYSLNLFIQVPDTIEEIMVYRRCRRAPSVQSEKKTACTECGEDFCWCSLSTKSKQQSAKERKEARLKAKTEAHAKTIKQLKANPMSWVENPYQFGRFNTLLTLMRARDIFANVTEERVKSLLPSYAVWLWRARRTNVVEVKTKHGNIFMQVYLNRWDLMNQFLDDMERNT